LNQRPKKVWIIVAYYPPDGGAGTPIYCAIAESLAAENFDISVITSFPHYKKTRPLLEKGKWFSREEKSGVHVFRGIVYAGDVSNIGKRFINYLSMDFSATITTFRLPKPDLVLITTPLMMIGFSALLAKLCRGVPFLYNVQDLYPDAVVQAGAVKQGWVSRLLAMQERWAYKYSSHIVTISEGQKEALVKRGVSGGKITIIPNFVDTSFISPIGKETTVRGNLNLNDKTVVSYFGNLGLAQSVETILLAAKILQKHPHIHFVIVGDGVKRESLREMRITHALDNVTIMDYPPREKTSEWLATADISLVSLKRGVSTFAPPSKTWSIMASGRPLIATVEEESDLGKIIQRTGAGLVVPPENPNALADAIVQLAASPEMREKMGKAGRSYVETYLNQPKVMSQWIELIQETIALCAKGNSNRSRSV